MGDDAYGYKFNMYFTALDFDGDGVDNEVVIEDSQVLLVYNLDTGTLITALDLYDYGGFDYAVGSVDDIVGDDVVYMYGKKSNTFIASSLGTAEVGPLYPTAKVNRNRRIVVTDLEEFIQ